MSNTEKMISVPEGYMLVERSIWTEAQVESATASITLLKGVPGMTDRDLAMAAIDAAQCKAPDIGLADLLPPERPPASHPEGRRERFEKWALGTKHRVFGYLDGIWLTRSEDREGYANEYVQGLWVAYKEFAQPAEQRQGELVGEVVAFGKGLHEIAWAAGRMPKLGAKLYTSADHYEVERLRSIERSYGLREALLEQVKGERDRMIARTLELGALLAKVVKSGALSSDQHEALEAECCALSASAEPSAPNDCAICRDLGNQCMECEEAEFREWADRHFAAADYRKTDAGVFIQDWMRHAYAAWCARGALERQP